MSRDSRSWRSTWRRTPEPLRPPARPSPSLRVVLSPWSALCSRDRGASSPASWCVCCGWTPWAPFCPGRVSVVCAVNPLCPVNPTPLDLDGQLGEAWPAAAPQTLEQREQAWPPGELPALPQVPQPQGRRALVLKAGLSVGQPCPPGDIRCCLEMFLVVSHIWGVGEGCAIGTSG